MPNTQGTQATTQTTPNTQGATGVNPLPIPQPSTQTTDVLFAKMNEVLALNDTLKVALQQATQAILDASVATEEQISLVVEWTHDTPADVTLRNGVVIPNATKLINETEAKVQLKLDEIPPKWESLKLDLQTAFDTDLARYRQEIADLQDDSRARFEALMQDLELQKQTQDTEFSALKKELEDALLAIQADRLLQEFSALQIAVQKESNVMKRELKKMENLALGNLSVQATQGVLIQSLLMREFKETIAKKL